jgi:integrase/recombinase XerD
LSVSSQRHRLFALRAWFTWLAREGHLLVNPAAQLKLPQEEKRLPRHALTVTEVEAVLEQPDITTPLGLRDRAFMETLYSTGIRRQELARLELGDVDRERHTFLIRQGKGKKDRVVPIGDRGLAWIDKYQREARPQLLRDEGRQTLFLSNTGRPLHLNHLSQIVRGYVKRAGIAKRGACHLFRHTAATLMLEGGADVRYIQALLGHAKLNTTEIYTHVSIDKLREVHKKTHPAKFKSRKGSDASEAKREDDKKESD